MDGSESPVEDVEFVARPHGQLMNIPVQMRWEFTRRHPYYLGLWQLARQHTRDTAAGTVNPTDTTGLAAKLALGAIGVCGEPVPPATPFDDIAGDDPQFLCGSVQPITFRGIALLLLGQLSLDSQDDLSGLLFTWVANDRDPNLTADQRQANRAALLNYLACHPHPDFDKVSGSPLFLMHLDASQETIKEDANRQARIWKAKLGKGSAKVHTTKLYEYLLVWDFFEGWTGEGYDIGREWALKHIAEKMQKKVSTVHDRLRAAFRLIIGGEFTLDRWWATMGRLKLAQLAERTDEAAAKLARRRFARYARRPVPMTTLVSAHTEPTTDPIQVAAGEADDNGTRDLVSDLLHLIAVGKTDDEILTELNLINPTSRKLLTFVRAKQIDLDQLFG